MKIAASTSVSLLIIFRLLLTSTYSFAQLQFIENKGQWTKQVDYKADIQNGTFYLERSGFTVKLQDAKDLNAFADQMHGHSSENEKSKLVNQQTFHPVTIHSHAYKVNFLNASSLVQLMPDKALPTYNNYFIGNDQSKWKGNCKIFQGITYRNMYPNIDIRYYTDRGSLKYDIIVHPGGNVKDIALEYKGVNKLSVKNKELVIGTSLGELTELYPYTYQFADKRRQTLDCKYVVEKNVVRFKVEDYDKTSTLVIDPTLIFCSFVGSTKDTWGYTATPGPDGSMFAGGISFDGGYPVSLGAYDETYNGGADQDGNGGYDIGIIKLSPDGRSRMYGTYLGGRVNEQPHSMITDAQGNLVIAGRTNSNDDYPQTTPKVGPCKNYDIFVTKLNAAGNALIGSILIGGTDDDGVNIRPKWTSLGIPGQTDGAFDTRRNYGDDARSEVILGAGNTIYLASSSQSADFPRVNAFQNTFGGSTNPVIKQDGVILKFSANLSTVLFSTFFGGTGNDACFVLTINPLTGNLYVGGGTTSLDLPGDKNGVMSPTYQGGITDGFVTEITPDGSAIIKTTYIGTSNPDRGKDGNDLVHGIKCDKFGFPYITGTTTGTWLAANAGFSNTGGKQFIGKLKQDLSGYVYTTMFGNNSDIPNISPTAFLVDRCQNVYVSGWGGEFNNNHGYPCAGTGDLGFLITPGAVKTATDRKDFFFFVLERNATSQLFGSFFGQDRGFDDHVDGGTSRFDENGIIYQAICANCGTHSSDVVFPTTLGVWSPNNQSVGCNEAVVKIEMNFGGVGASVKATINGVLDTIGCVPLTVRFTDTLAKGKRYMWDFGDNTPKVETVAPNNSVSHEYTNVGTYRLMLVSIDSSTCNIADTAYTTVKVGNNTVVPNFTVSKTGGCESLTFQFTNTSTAPLPTFSPTSFLWDFGDNSPLVRAGLEPKIHTYPSAGTYIVKLVADDTTFCNAPDSISKTVRLAVNVKAQFTTPDKGCVPYTATFTNTSLGGIDFLWDFGDNSPQSSDVNPSHLFTGTGTFNVRLIAVDTSTCNKRDTSFFPVTVFPIPTAGFNFSPVQPQENTPVDFINRSVNESAYLWNFGDGETSTERNPRHLFNETKIFDVCLVAFSVAGCTDTICQPVRAIIVPLLDVPNAFTPGKFGVNGVVKVQGYGIRKMEWKIYNRWGQLIYTTTDRNQGWDGTFKGALQPLDVYTYTLDVVFTDGKKFRKTGDITLLR